MNIGKIIAAVLLAAITSSSRASTINAADTTRTAVNTSIASASDGDTVIIPPGTASWTQGISTTKAITIQGASTTGAGVDPNYTFNAIDNTILLDDLPLGTHMFTYTGTGTFRITGITFKVGSRTTADTTGAMVNLKSSSSTASVRQDHCHFDHIKGFATNVTQTCLPVIDHNIYDEAEPNNEVIIFNAPTWGGKTFGDGSWADDPYWGTNKAIFFETNQINNFAATNAFCGFIDQLLAARSVIRYNQFNEAAGWGNHDTGVSDRNRGAKQTEAYHNTIAMSRLTIDKLGPNFRGGSGMLWGNTYTGTVGAGYNLGTYRMTYPNSPARWGEDAAGRNPWDLNDVTDQTGNGYGGSTGGLYASGTASGTGSASLGQITMTVSGSPGWPTDHWVGYSITNLDLLAGVTPTFAGVPIGSYITGNTSSTITAVQNAAKTPKLTWVNGNHYEIRKPLAALDNAGRGKGDLLTGAQPLNGGVIAWPNQALLPIYSWSNTLNGANFANYLSSGVRPALAENTDYYNQAEAVSGAQTVGVGVGTLASRPTNCTTGVGYFATDHGSQGTLYLCASTNTWSTDGDGTTYAPYQYPHPLTQTASVPIWVTSNSAHVGVGIAVSGLTVSASGSPTPTYSVGAGFPSWATLNSTTGAITGTPPNQTGSPFTFTLTATNSQGTADQSYTLTVDSPSTSVIRLTLDSVIRGPWDKTYIGDTSFRYIVINNDGNSLLYPTAATHSNNQFTTVGYRMSPQDNPDLSNDGIGGTASVAPSGGIGVIIKVHPNKAGTITDTMTVVSDATGGTNTIELSITAVKKPKLKSHRNLPTGIHRPPL